MGSPSTVPARGRIDSEHLPDTIQNQVSRKVADSARANGIVLFGQILTKKRERRRRGGEGGHQLLDVALDGGFRPIIAAAIAEAITSGKMELSLIAPVVRIPMNGVAEHRPLESFRHLRNFNAAAISEPLALDLAQRENRLTERERQ